MKLLQTERISIRTLQQEDAITYSKMASDGSLRDIGFDQNCGEWMTDWITDAVKLTDADDPQKEYLAYAIVSRENDVVIGSVGCSYYEDLQKTGITYFIGADYRNKGYAVEAVRAYVEYFMEHYNVTQLIATIREENRASWKVIEKSGFELTDKRLYQDMNDNEEKMYRFYTRFL